MTRLLLTLLSATLLPAQIKSGAIGGRVTDPSGGVIPRAAVLITNTSTNQTWRLATNDAGDYFAPYLAPGAYAVEVALAGFTTFRARDLALAPNQTLRIDAVLHLGRVDTVADVKAAPEPLQTDSSTVQSAADAAAIAAIPNVSRNPLYYAILQEGVVPRRAMLDTTGPYAFGVGYQSRRNFTAFSISGASAFTNEVLLDGISIIGSAWNEATVLPNLNGLAEVRVLQNNYSAEYGHGQGIVSMFTRAGANRFHGDPHFDWRNDPHPEYTYADAVRNLPPGPVRVLDFGFTLGGPVVLPRVYNGRDRFFFFVAWERLGHQDSPQWLLRLPTPRERRADFSQTLIPGDDGQPVPAAVFDPFSARPAGGNLFQRLPYPNAVIPAISPYARNIFDLYPDPNRAPEDAFQNGNYYVTRPRRLYRQSLTSRLDHRFGRHSLYGTWGFTRGSIRTARPFGDASPVWLAPNYGGASSENVRDRNAYATLGDTVVIAPNLLTDFRYGVSRVNSNAHSGLATQPFDYNAIGMPRNVQSLVFDPGHPPDLTLSPFNSPSRSTSDNKEERQLNHQAAGSVTYNRGAWTYKGGAEFRNQLANNTDPVTAAASLEIPSGSNRNFAAEYVTADGRLSPLNANPWQRGLAAAALFGGAAYWTNPGAVRMALSHKYAALYTQNQWRVHSRLGLTLGLRWDWQPAPSERYNRLAAIDFDATNPFGGRGALAFPGSVGYGRGLWNTEWSDWQPRLGFAWRPAASLVVRGGYGLTYLPTNVGYSTSVQSFGSLAFVSRIDPRPFGSDPQGIPAGRFWDASIHAIVPPARGGKALPELYGGSGAYFDRDRTRNGRVHQANLFLEKRLSSNWVVSAGYAGARGARLQNAQWQLNNDQRIPPATLQAWRAEYIRTAGAHNPANDLVANPFQPLSGSLLPFAGALGNRTLARRVTLYPYPVLADVTLQATNGFSNYHSLQLRLNRAFARGILVRAHYTWSKSTDFSNTPLQWGQGLDDSPGALNGDNSHMDLENLRNNTKLSYSDQPHRFILTAVWDLPFGRERLGASLPVLRHALKDWTASAVMLVHSGPPQGIGGLDAGSTVGRQNRIPGVPIEVPEDLQRWYDGKTTVTLPSGRRITPCAYCFLRYNSDAFSAPYITNPDGSIVNDLYWTPTGAINYGDIRAPGRANLDVRLSRRIPLRRRIALQLTAGITNALDNIQYNTGCDGNLGSLVTRNDPAHGFLPGYGSSSNFGTHYPTSYDRRQILMHMNLQF